MLFQINLVIRLKFIRILIIFALIYAVIPMGGVRIDKWLWAIRVFKTRTDAADACRNGRVYINGGLTKPSREIKPGDEISVRKSFITFSYKVLGEVSNRLPAKDVPTYALNITPQEELDKLSVPRETIFVSRDRGTGRPTKKERRDIDSLMDDFYYVGDDED